MLVANVFDAFSAPCFAFFSKDQPKAEATEAELEEYNKDKEAFLTLMEVADLRDNVTLKFSLGSVVFDLINSAINLRVFVMPESPKLLKRIEKQFVDFAQIADNEGEIDIPDSWIPIIDKLFNDDALFANIALHGEITSTGETKKALPVKGRVLSTMLKLNNALLEVLPV